MSDSFIAIQPEQQQTLQIQRDAWEQLAARLISIGGQKVVVPMWPDQLLRKLIYGQQFPLDNIELRVGRRSGCHSNVARIFVAGEGKIATGYGLSEDGYWRQHSWAIGDGGHVIETTLLRDVYFGLQLPDAIAEIWATAQL